MADGRGVTPQEQGRALWLSTIAFTVCFAVWTIFAIIGIRIKEELGLNETQFGLLVGTPILTGSLIRLALGIWTDQYGGRLVYTLTMLSAAVATFALSYAQTYPQISAGGARCRHRRRFVCRRRRLRVALVSDREAGHRAWHFRRRQCRRGGDQVHRALRAGRLWLAGDGSGLGGRHRPDGHRLLVHRRPTIRCCASGAPAARSRPVHGLSLSR